MNKQRNTKQQQSGFSLVELMVALAVFSVISAASFVGLNSAIRSYSFFTQESADEARSEVFIALITKDFLQVVPRIVRDSNGDYQPAFKLGGAYLVELSRGGQPLIGQSTGISRIAYKKEKDTIWRYTWPFLDNINTTEPSKALVLENVKSIKITAINEALKKSEKWPSTQSFDKRVYALIPQAIQVKIDIEGDGKTERFIPGVSRVYVTKDVNEPLDEASENSNTDASSDQQPTDESQGATGG